MINEWNVTGKREYPHIKELFNIDRDAIKLDQEQHESFHRCVGKLIYLAHHCRPDILCSTIFLSSRVQESTTQDWNKLMHLLKYLNSTPNLGLCLQPDKDGKFTVLLKI